MPELTAQGLVEKVAKDKLLSLYLPDLKDETGKCRTISRQYLFNVINTLKPDFFPENIRDLMKRRKDMDAEKHQTVVDIKANIYNLIMNSQQINKSSRGKAVHLLSAALATKKRKRPDRDYQKLELAVQLESSYAPTKGKTLNVSSKLPTIQEYGKGNASKKSVLGGGAITLAR